METRGSNSNLSEILCLSWWLATLMMIRSKMNELAWRHHFPIISLWKFKLFRDFRHVLVTCKYKKDLIKNNRPNVETSFSPLYVDRGFLLPWKPQFWSNLPQNLMQPFTHPNDATYKIWSRLANWLQRYSSSNVWNFCHSRTSNSKNEWSDSAQNRTPLSFYACPGYQQLWWWFNQKWMS